MLCATLKRTPFRLGVRPRLDQVWRTVAMLLSQPDGEHPQAPEYRALRAAHFESSVGNATGQSYFPASRVEGAVVVRTLIARTDMSRLSELDTASRLESGENARPRTIP